MYNLWIEAENFCGWTIAGSDKRKQGGIFRCLEHVKDVNTGESYLIIFEDGKAYSFKE